MKRVLSIWIALMLLVLALPSALSVKNVNTDHLVINEICWPDYRMAWFELYNPTNRSIDVTNWLIWFYSVDGPIQMPPVLIHPNEYIVVCGNKDNFIKDWGPPENVKIVELDGWGYKNDSITISNENGQMDIVGVDNHPGFLPSAGLNHSWARYKGGFDTDNFTNDFYDEPYPTPGRENPREKTEVHEGTTAIYLLSIAIAVIVLLSYIGWRRRTSR